MSVIDRRKEIRGEKMGKEKGRKAEKAFVPVSGHDVGLFMDGRILLADTRMPGTMFDLNPYERRLI